MAGRNLLLYLDETKKEVGDQHLLLVGGLLTRDYLGPAPWLMDLFYSPHATERTDPHPRGAQTCRALAMWGGLEKIVVLATALPGDGSLKHAYDSAYLGLLVQLILRLGLSAEDTLTLYPEPWDSDIYETRGRMKGIVGSLRWIVDLKLPEIKIQVQPKKKNKNKRHGEPFYHVLLGQSMIDLILWNVRADITSARTWKTTSRGVLSGLDLDTRALLLSAPPLHRPAALFSYAALSSGRSEAVDWSVLARELKKDHLAEVVGVARAWPVAAQKRLLKEAHSQLAPMINNPRRAKAAGVPMNQLGWVLDALGSLECPDAPVARRQAFLTARTLSHLGRPAPALEAWRCWDDLISADALSPELLEETLTGLNAQAVILTDLCRFDDAIDQLALAESLIEAHLSAFEQIPVLARVLGAYAQARILSGDPDDAVEVLARAAAHLPDAAGLSYPWTWTLVALGRGATVDDPARCMAAILDQALRHSPHDTLQVLLEDNRFLLWGASEALLRPGMAAEPTLVEAVDRAAMSVIDQHPKGVLKHPINLIVRAHGIRTQTPSLIRRSLKGINPRGLSTGAPRPRIDLRGLVALWAMDGPSDVERIHLKVTEAEQALPDAPLYDGVRAWIVAFLSLDASSPDACRAFLARGGY